MFHGIEEHQCGRSGLDASNALDENLLVSSKYNKAKIKRKVSTYGSTNVSEMIAEVWADYTMNPKPKPHVKQMGDAIKSVVKTLSTSRRKFV